MNELNVNLQHSIVALSANGWSRRRIARELGINRETVGRYLRLALVHRDGYVEFQRTY